MSEYVLGNNIRQTAIRTATATAGLTTHLTTTLTTLLAPCGKLQYLYSQAVACFIPLKQREIRELHFEFPNNFYLS